MNRRLLLLLGGLPNWVLPGASVDIDFVNNRYFVQGLGSSLSPFTFTRASAATYFDVTGTLQTAGSGVARTACCDPVTHAPLGYLSEVTATNIALQNTSLTTSPWTLFGSYQPTLTANAATAPDGTNTATQIAAQAVSTGTGVVYQNLTLAAVSYTFSVYLKGAVGGEVVYIGTNKAGASFASTKCTLTTTWTRYTLTFTAASSGTWVFDIGTDLRDGTQSSTSAQTFYAWGAQAETGSFASSLIYTAGSTVARAADSLTLSVSSGSWYGQDQIGSLFIQMTGAANVVTRLLSLSSASQFTGITINGSNRVNIFDGTVGLNSVIMLQPTPPYKAAFSFTPGSQIGVGNATNVVTTSAASLTTGITTFGIGLGDGGANPGTYIGRASYFPTMLTQAQLVTITT
jgi:hypothetical protein